MWSPLLVAALCAAPLPHDNDGCVREDDAPLALYPLVEGHGDVEWFDGSYEDALAQAEATGRMVFLDFWTEWCGYCKRLDREAFSTPAVVEELGAVVCVSIDAESESGSAIARRFGVSGYPTLLFLEPDGSPRDAIVGYVRATPFLEELRRVKSGVDTIPALEARIAADGADLGARFALIEKLEAFAAAAAIDEQRGAIARLITEGHGFEPASPESRWTLYGRLRAAGMEELAEEQLAAIRRLDPEGRSLPMRRLAFEELLATIHGRADLPRLEAFLAEETYDEILFEGWLRMYSTYDRASRKTRDGDERRANRKHARKVAPTLWRHTPQKHVAEIGNVIAWGYYEDARDLTLEERGWALGVAKVAMDASDEEVAVIDTYACLLFLNGHVEDALHHVDRCIELDPDNREWRRRRTEFERAAR